MRGWVGKREVLLERESNERESESDLCSISVASLEHRLVRYDFDNASRIRVMASTYHRR